MKASSSSFLRQHLPAHIRKSLRPNAGTEARSSYLLTAVVGGFAMTLVRNETQRHSAVLKSAGQNPIDLLLLNSKKHSPVCSSSPQFVLVCFIYTQSQKMPRIHGVKSGSRIFRPPVAFLRVTVGHGKLRVVPNSRTGTISQGRAR